MKRTIARHEVVIYARAGQVIMESRAENDDVVTFVWDLPEANKVLDSLEEAVDNAEQQVYDQEDQQGFEKPLPSRSWLSRLLG